MPLTFPALQKGPFATTQAKSQASTPVARDYAIKEHFRTSSVGVPMPFVVRGDVGSPMDFDNGKPVRWRSGRLNYAEISTGPAVDDR